MSKKKDSTKPVVAVFGGSGYTGRFVIAELLSRKMKPIAIARNQRHFQRRTFSRARSSFVRRPLTMQRPLIEHYTELKSTTRPWEI